LAAALFVLNVTLTFESAWPTPGIRWRGALSIESAVLVLILMAAGRWYLPSRRARRRIAATWLVLVVGRYLSVSSAALYGREVNLLWDVRFIPDVVAMLARPERLWVVGLAVAAALLILVLAYVVLLYVIGRICQAAASVGERRVAAALAVVVMAAWAVAEEEVPGRSASAFARPVTATYARQMQLVSATLRGSTAVAPSPSMDSDLSRVKGADVFLFFVEAYGAVAYDRPEFATRLSADRLALESAIRDTNRQVLSAYVESPTFGGSSWLAHISLLSGVEVRSHDTNALLMSQNRETMVTAFKRRGYRTVAVMPGMWQAWPEGRFYGFDALYGGESLEYEGPPFGWWDMTDQFALAKLDAEEVNRAPRAPLFVFFPTISTHIPFTPTPPYQRDWSRMLTKAPYDEADVERAYERQPDWLDLGASYADAVSYMYRSVTGYVGLQGARDFVMVLIGDHQPAAAVSGEQATWDVPVHIITGRPSVLERLQMEGFRPGLSPARPVLGAMHQLTPILLAAFGDPDPAGGGKTDDK
jgi:hypothetical protein